MSEAATIEDELFDGHAVVDRKVKITKAGDGLSEALAIHGADLKAGDTVDIVLRATVGGATFKPEKAGEEGGDYIRIDNLVAQSATLVESSTITKVLDKHEAAVAEARVAAKEARDGLKRLAFDDTTADGDQAGEDGVTPSNVRKIGGDDWEGDGEGSEPDAGE